MYSDYDIALSYRQLTTEEIHCLQQQNCTAEDWNRIEVHPDIDVSFLSQVHFSGKNKLGLFEKTFLLPGGLRKHSGIRYTTLHEATVGDNCLIENCDCIAHYDIQENCRILQSGNLVVEGTSTFGQGEEITVLSETGGREIILHEHLSAQEAYLQAMYRHRPTFTDRLRKLALDFAETRRSDRGTIGHDSCIIRCGTIYNVNIGAHSHIEGTARLENTTVCSHPDAPTYIGDSVIIRRSIIQTDCRITDGAMLERCYIGQASVVGHGYSASDSFFGCNCQAENGEACAVFAGPYTVTHHKSTLLIGGMFSFMNAGSGTNQSNHMYKLGPSHHGVLERGCKTASSSHILWPARVGAFSLVIGHCSAHADTHRFPFSYIATQQQGEYLIPGIALRNVGTLRDIRKWAERDRRPDSLSRQDKLSFNAYSPYTIGAMLQGLKELKHMETQLSASNGEFLWNGLKIKQKAVTAGQKLYQAAIDRFIGEQLLEQLQGRTNLTSESLYSTLPPQADYCEQWCDIGGLLAPQNEIREIENNVTDGTITTIEELDRRFADIQHRYKAYAWAWSWHHIQETYPVARPTDFIRLACLPILNKWETASLSLNSQIVADARKEFAPAVRVGFGIDGNKEDIEADFLAVRGCPDNHPLIQELKRQQTEIKEKAAHWLNLLKP